MIVRMKEISLFTSARSATDTVVRLGELGVVDLKEIGTTHNHSVARYTDLVERAQSAISILENYGDNHADETNRKRYEESDPKNLVDRILRSGHIRKQCKEKLAELSVQAEWYSTWGAKTDIKDIAFLEGNGIFTKLYLADKEKLKTIPDDLCVVQLPEHNGVIPVALFGRDQDDRLNLGPEQALPTLPAPIVDKQISRKKRQIAEIDIYLGDQYSNIRLLEDYRDELKDKLDVYSTLEGMGDIQGAAKYLKGFLPVDQVEEFKQVAAEKHWGYHISEPDDPEDVPVLVKNPRWISIIDPVMKFIDIVPGYKEVDVSIYFLVAFALFFAMLVGDAGYGLIFLAATIIFGRKLPAQPRFLIYVLSIATIVWGVLTGTYFGSVTIAAIPALNSLIVPEMSSFGVDNIAFMMHLSFVIGVIHLTIAHGIRIVQFINSIKALSEVGWIALMWGLFFVAENLVLGEPIPGFTKWLFISGGVLVAFFSMEGKTIWSSIANSLSGLPLSLINGFSDIVSYVRLFAVGLATSTVAASFNNMILPDGLEGMTIIGFVLAALGLLVGHALNIVLALMAVMVHGIRLNMLEFAGHVGVQFSGEAYDPFKLNSPGKIEINQLTPESNNDNL